jgi:site-specific recombinase XerC
VAERGERVVHLDLTRTEADHLKWLLANHMKQGSGARSLATALVQWREVFSAWPDIYEQLKDARRKAVVPRA